MKNLLTILLTLAFSISAFAAATPEKNPQQDEVNVDENNMNKKDQNKKEKEEVKK